MAATKQKMILYINRRIRALEAEEPNHERMAANGVSYAQRRAMMATSGSQQSRHADEIEALTAAVRLIEGSGD